MSHERQHGLQTLAGVLVALTVAIGGCRRDQPAYVPGLGDVITRPTGNAFFNQNFAPSTASR